MEKKTKVTNDQFRGVIKMIISMIEDDQPKEKILKYLRELLNEKN